jgi:hypothetical protein
MKLVIAKALFGANCIRLNMPLRRESFRSQLCYLAGIRPDPRLIHLNFSSAGVCALHSCLGSALNLVLRKEVG